MLKLLRRLFRRPVQDKPEPIALNSGDLITAITGGANLVDGVPTWQLADEKKHDLATMRKCCDAELRSMAAGGGVAAPFYFERVAILLRKRKDFDGELEVCQTYIAALERFYSSPSRIGSVDVRKGPRYAAILKRMAKARILADRARAGSVND